MDRKPVVGDENEWEVRPGGMLVQKRDPDGETNRVPPPTIRVRVKYGPVYHEININSQATFGKQLVTLDSFSNYLMKLFICLLRFNTKISLKVFVIAYLFKYFL